MIILPRMRRMRFFSGCIVYVMWCRKIFFEYYFLNRLPKTKLPLDEFSILPIIGRNHTLMYTTFSSLLLIVVVLVVLIIKDQFSVRMAKVRAK